MSALGAIYGELIGTALLTVVVALLSVYAALCAAILGLVVW